MLALAASVHYSYAGKDDPSWNPPARYDIPYKGRLVVEYLPQPEVYKKCLNMFRMAGVDDPAQGVRGCARPYPDHCVVFIVNETWKGSTREAILRHELGHCNGWHPSHPD